MRTITTPTTSITTMMKIIDKGRKLCGIIFSGNVLWWKALCIGVAAGIEHRSALRSLNCRTVIDIGANRGQFALAAREAFPDAKIYSFEPLPLPAQLFRRVFGADSSIALHETAVGTDPGTHWMHQSARDDSSSFFPISERQESLFPGTQEIGLVEVCVSRLEACLNTNVVVPPAVLKIDVQGYELQALRACECVFEKLSFVYVECSFVELYKGQCLVHEIVRYLETHGFVLRSIHNIAYDPAGLAVQADIMFARRE